MFYNAFCRSRLTYCCSCWVVTEKQKKNVERCQVKHLRSMMKGGWERKGGPRTLEDEIGYNFAYVFNKKRLYGASKIEPVLDFVESQRAKWIAHVVRYDNDRMAKQTMFEVSQFSRTGRTSSILDELLRETRKYDLSDDVVYKACVNRELFSLHMYLKIEALYSPRDNMEISTYVRIPLFKINVMLCYVIGVVELLRVFERSLVETGV